MTTTIIVIDDDQDDLDTLSDAIREIDSSMVCLSFTNPETAINIMTTEFLVPNYIFVDINMPLMTGDQCLKVLRNLESFREVVIIMLSTSMPSSVSNQLKQLGANFTFQKPLKFEDYHQFLKTIFTRT
jgi:CheY-like chemotaxis protein